MSTTAEEKAFIDKLDNERELIATLNGKRCLLTGRQYKQLPAVERPPLEELIITYDWRTFLPPTSNNMEDD
jgi:hypothetical protein